MAWAVGTVWLVNIGSSETGKFMAVAFPKALVTDFAGLSLPAWH
jgi:hypothetical protein